MTDKEFLWWIHERLVSVHGEMELSDYMHHLRAIIIDLPCEKETPSIARVATNPTNTKEYMECLRSTIRHEQDCALVAAEAAITRALEQKP